MTFNINGKTIPKKLQLDMQSVIDGVRKLRPNNKTVDTCALCTGRKCSKCEALRDCILTGKIDTIIEKLEHFLKGW